MSLVDIKRIEFKVERRISINTLKLEDALAYQETARRPALLESNT